MSERLTAAVFLSPPSTGHICSECGLHCSRSAKLCGGRGSSPTGGGLIHRCGRVSSPSSRPSARRNAAHPAFSMGHRSQFQQLDTLAPSLEETKPAVGGAEETRFSREARQSMKCWRKSAPFAPSPHFNSLFLFCLLKSTAKEPKCAHDLSTPLPPSAG